MIDLGNSNDGPIGMVLRVNTVTRADAIEVAQQALRLVSGDLGEVTLRVPAEIKEAVEYIHFYVNPNAITEADVLEDGTQETQE